MNVIDQRIEEIARDIFDDDELVITDATVASEVRGWDSLAHVNFMYSLEEAFDVQFSEDEFVGFENVGALKRILALKIGVLDAGEALPVRPS